MLVSFLSSRSSGLLHLFSKELCEPSNVRRFCRFNFSIGSFPHLFALTYSSIDLKFNLLFTGRVLYLCHTQPLNNIIRHKENQLDKEMLCE
jgi:hypothetical protein